jgi:hypothetical protein
LDILTKKNNNKNLKKKLNNFSMDRIGDVGALTFSDALSSTTNISSTDGGYSLIDTATDSN